MGCIGQSQLYTDQSLAYFRKLEADRIAQTGISLEYYSLNRGVNVDALYGEPDNDPLYGGSSVVGSDQQHDMSWNFSPDVAGGESPFNLYCIVEYSESEDRNVMTRPEGQHIEYDAIMYMAYNHWECGLLDLDNSSLTGRTPKEDDVIYVGEIWFDVVKVGGAGYVNGTLSYVGYKFELKRREQFVPERKVE